MNDGIIKNNGTSRLMRATLPATYEEFKRACEAGTQLLDVLFNAAGWAQLPDFLNKGNLWADDTAALFGLGQDSVPDDGFKKVYEQNKNTESKITKELLLKVKDTPENQSQVSFAIDFSDYDITKYKSAIITFDAYISHNGGPLKIAIPGAYLDYTGFRPSGDAVTNISIGVSDPLGTISSLKMVRSFEIQLQYTKQITNGRSLIIGTIRQLGTTTDPVIGFYGADISSNSIINRTLTFTLNSDGGKAAFKHIEVFGERYV